MVSASLAWGTPSIAARQRGLETQTHGVRRKGHERDQPNCGSLCADVLRRAGLGRGISPGEYHAAHVGQATAGITMAENAGVVATLPAAMVRLPAGIHALAGVTRYDARYEAGSLDSPASVESKNDPALVPHLYAVQAGDGWAWGIGWGIGGEGFAGYRRFSRGLSAAAMPVV